ncbi:MAG TPA: flavin reductase family protein [Rhodoblastus sp.]|nr:flavin reductase family protein [Rhodoblastus sp.]
MAAQTMEAVVTSGPPAPPERDAFRSGMRSLAHGVCVIALGEGAARNGLTATSVVSLAADPPTLLFCVNKTSSARPALQAGAAVSVNILSGAQEIVADSFAGRGGQKGAARFAEGDWRQDAGGPPVLVDSLVSFVCEIEETIERHSHAIVTARVVETRVREDQCALVYAQGGYDRIGWSALEVRAVAGLPESPRRADDNRQTIIDLRTQRI